MTIPFQDLKGPGDPPADEMVRCGCGCGLTPDAQAPGKTSPLYIGGFMKRQRSRAVFVDTTHQTLYFTTRPSEVVP